MGNDTPRTRLARSYHRMDSKFAGQYRVNMKITVHADDGHSASIVISDKTTAAQVVESYVKLRTLTQTSITHPDAQDCLLTYESSKDAAALSLGEDVIVEKALKGFPHGGRLVCLGYKAQQRFSALSDMYEFTARMTLARAVLAKSLSTVNEIDDTDGDQNAIRDDIQARTESYLAEVHRVLDAAISTGGTEAATFAAAKDALSAGDVVKMIGVLNLPHVFTAPASSSSNSSSNDATGSCSSRPTTATKSKPPAKGKEAANAIATAPAAAPALPAAPVPTVGVDSTGKPLSKAALARAKKAAAVAAAQSATASAVNSDNGAPSEHTSLVPPIHPTPAAAKKNAAAAKQVAVSVPATAAHDSQNDGSSSSSESSSSGSSSSGSESGSESDSESEAEEMGVATNNPLPLAGVEPTGAAQQKQQPENASPVRSRSGSESSVSSSGSSGSSSSSSGSSSSGSDSDSDDEVEQVDAGTGTASTTATTVAGVGAGAMEVDEAAPARGLVSRDIENQMLTQASQGDDADQEDGFNAESYLRGARAQVHSPLLASPNGGVQMTGTQVDDGDEQDDTNHAAPAIATATATAAGAGYESDSESSGGSSSGSDSGSGSEKNSSGNESSDSDSDSDSDAGSVGGARRLVQPAAPATVAKTPSALTSLLIRPSAMKPASSYLPPAQQKEASQTLELERQLFPKLAPATPAQGSDSDSDSASGGGDLSSASDSEGSSSDCDEDNADSADGADGHESGSEAEKVIFAPAEAKKFTSTPKTAKKEPRKKPAVGASSSAPTSPAGEVVKRKAGRPKGSGGAVAPGTAPAKAAGGAGRGAGAGRGGRGGRGGVTSPEGGRGAGRGGRGATSKRRDIDPTLLKSMIAGTATVSATSSEPAPGASAPIATAGADAMVGGLASPADRKKRKTAAAPEQGSPAVASPQLKKAKKGVPSASP